MKALILAAGKGTRLMPFTKTIPKCLIPINKKPLLELWLEKLSDIGVNEFLINTHYLASAVNKYVEKSIFKNQITLVHEKELLGTAGTLINNLSFFENSPDTFFLHGDNYTDDNLKEFIRCHKNRPKECIITMMTFETDKPEEAGIVITKNGILKRYYEKQKNSNHGNIANGAIYLFGKDFIKIIKKKFLNTYDFSKDIVPSLPNKVFTYKTESSFIDIGTPANYQKVK
ncbi:nucleotidyltransferase family protein [bacterium]|nr:nucleotidyltransferase family protein [Pelagibacteraceae bacterium]MDC3130684.1 nucleotidyltransferase family protein [bacterium]